MKQLLGSGGLFAGAALVLLATQPAWAQATKVTAIQLNPTKSGVNVVLGTQGARPQVVTVSEGNTLVADVMNAQLSLPQGQDFRQENPAPGIAAIAITQLDANSVRMIVTGTNGAPQGQIAEPSDRGIALSISPGSGTAANPTATPPGNNPIVPKSASTRQSATPAQPQPQQTPTAQRPPGQKPDVLIPNPKITIDGKPLPPTGVAQPPVNQTPPPPFLPRAVAPPVGDIAISNSDASPDSIDLDTNEQVPRLVLRDAPAREVLALLARAAGLNLAFTTAQPPGQQGQPTPTAQEGDEGPRLSLDIQDESVQDVFNYVLRIAGLQANRSGRTIFVGPRLPNQARDVIVRSYRLNQIDVASALNYLVALGAESAVSRERTITSVNAVPVGGTAQPATQTQTSTETRIETQRIDLQDSNPILRGLEVVGDERTNAVTLIGSPKQVDLAAAQLVQLDLRRRQVSVNVKILDVDLGATDDFNTSFSFGVGDTFFQNDGTSSYLNFGTTNPASGPQSPAPGFSRRFLARLQAAVSDSSAKILTDPTLTIQEGQSAQVNLTQDVFGGTETTLLSIGGEGDDSFPSTRPIIKQAGLTLVLRVERIDDNGFVSLQVAPTVSAPYDSIPATNAVGGTDEIVLLNTRSLTSGVIRLRDGQSLILSGIIQDSDLTTVSKVPILGDIPILGALFRSTNKSTNRREVIVLLTPQVIDDSQNSSSMGYNYNPSPAVRQLLERSRGQQAPPSDNPKPRKK